MKIIFNLLLTLDSIALLLVIYLVKTSTWICNLGWFSVIIYLIIVLIVSYLCIIISNKLSKDSIEGEIIGVELANDSFLPIYLGYFFVALSIPNGELITLVVVFFIIFCFLLFSQNLYYNPIFLLFGFKFYYITNQSNVKFFIITKKEIKDTNNLCFTNLRRINYFTFIDGEKI